jgi:DNA-binding transcriptional MocR family regulator
MDREDREDREVDVTGTSWHLTGLFFSVHFCQTGLVPPADRILTARQLTGLMPSWRNAAGISYLRLAEAIRLLVLDGRIPLHSQLPAERELAKTLGVSRTTVSAAYGTLRDTGYLRSRRGARSWTALPSATNQATTQIGLAPVSDPNLLDLAHAALPAPATAVRHAVAAAATELAVHLTGHGYDAIGLPDLRAAVADHYGAAGVPTTPDQVLITHGAQHGLALALRLQVGPGDRVLVEHPTYPTALDAVRRAGARLVPVAVDPQSGWDVEMLEATVRQSAPRLAYLVPDFQNPTGHLMSASVRDRVSAFLRRTRTPVVIDETLRDLPLAGTSMPPPFATIDQSDHVITIESTGKSFWGGLRIGWMRASASMITRLAGIRPSIDLGTPVLEQLVVLFLLRDAAAVLEPRRAAIRHGRDFLAGLLAEHLPGLRFRPPDGGLAVWAELEEPVSSRLTVAAEHHGLQLAAGPRFGVDAAFERYLRIPYTLPEDQLEVAIPRLAAAYQSVLGRIPLSYERRLGVA